MSQQTGDRGSGSDICSNLGCSFGSGGHCGVGGQEAGGSKEGCLPLQRRKGGEQPGHSASFVTSSLVKSPSFHREHSSARGSRSLTQSTAWGLGLLSLSFTHYGLRSSPPEPTFSGSHKSGISNHKNDITLFCQHLHHFIYYLIFHWSGL